MHESNKATQFVIIATGALLFVHIASAQQAPSADQVPPSSVKLKTIIVTAERRSENIQTVPASISAVTGAQIRERDITNVEDLARTVPGLEFAAGGTPGMDTITIRGVSSAGGGATVGQYLDDVPIITQTSFEPPSPTSGAAQPALFDLARIEVLRGPQGTLYGDNSMGGAIRYITNAPNLDQYSFDTTDSLSHTAHGGTNYRVIAVANAPLDSGVLAIRGGVDVGELDGYIDRYSEIPLTESQVLAGNYLAQPGHLIDSNVNTQRTVAARLSALWRPMSNLSITPMIFAQRFNSGDVSAFYPALGLYVQDALVRQPSTDTLVVPSLTVTDNLGWANLSSITSYFFRQNAHTNDGTYFNSDFIQYLADTSPDLSYCQCGVAFTALGSPSYSEEQTQTTTEELRLTSPLPATTGIPLSYVAGLFISHRHIKTSEYDYIPGLNQTFLTLYGKLPQNTSFASPFPNDLAGFSAGAETDTQYALYGELTYYPTRRFKITGGVRGSHDVTSFTWLTGLYFAQGIAPLTNANNTFNSVTPKLTLSYNVTSNKMLYATASKGYRDGGYIVPIDLTTGLCPASLKAFGIVNPKLSYNSDSLWNYEGGMKTTWLDDRLLLNADAYYIDWANVQQTFALSCGSEYTANFGNAASYGGELEIKAKPLPGWSLSFDGDITHAYLTSVVPNVGATKGERLLNVPAYSATLSTEYDKGVNNSAIAFIRGDYDWIGPSHGSYLTTDPAYSYPSYTLLNASLGIRFNRYSVSLYAKNLLNDQRIIQRVTVELLENAYVPWPRTIGVQLRYAF